MTTQYTDGFQPPRDLVMRPTDQPTGIYYDEDGEPLLVVCQNGKNYKLLWYARGDAVLEPGDLLYRGAAIADHLFV